MGTEAQMGTSLDQFKKSTDSLPLTVFLVIIKFSKREILLYLQLLSLEVYSKTDSIS